MYPPQLDDLDLLRATQNPPLTDTITEKPGDAKVAENPPSPLLGEDVTKGLQEPIDDKTNDEEEDAFLMDIFRRAEEEDLDNRYNMLCRAKRNELYFNNIQQLVYDESARDYRTTDQIIAQLEDTLSVNNIKTNNIYRAFAESLIAALSVSPPAVEFIPDDSTDPDDIETADAYSHISELISRHNHAQLVLVKALTIFFNQGIIFGYNFIKSDIEYGSYSKYIGTTTKQIKVIDLRCKLCGDLIDSSVPLDTFNPNTPVACPECGYAGVPEAFEVWDYVNEPIYDNTPKARSLFDVFGCTHVKVPLYAKKQADCGYLILRVDDNCAKFQALYDPQATKFHISSEGGDTTKYERWARTPTAYSGAIPQHLTTARYAWLRPWYFYASEDSEKAYKLIQKYPDGICLTVIGDEILEKSHEKLDEAWTITFDPRSNFIHGEPAGNALIPMQDAENDIFNLGLQSIEYGIPETFVNPKTLNIQAYKKAGGGPGFMTKALPPGQNQNLSDGFFTVKPATMSNEYTSFAQQLNQKAQFVTGAFPSIFGGQPENESTATEYQQSNARALQRLQLTWIMISAFWGELIFKGVRLFALNMGGDEQFSKKEKGTYINVFISKASLKGRVGHVEPEVNGQLPQSWSQKKSFLMSLITLNNPQIGSILLHPNNSDMLKMITGLPEFYVPGENDRNKQYGEFYKLSTSQPNGTQSSVPVDMDVDEHPTHMQVLKNILVSPVGVNLYETNPVGYQNCILHYKEHQMAMQPPMNMPGQGPPQGIGPNTPQPQAGSNPPNPLAAPMGIPPKGPTPPNPAAGMNRR